MLIVLVVSDKETICVYLRARRGAGSDAISVRKLREFMIHPPHRGSFSPQIIITSSQSRAKCCTTRRVCSNRRQSIWISERDSSEPRQQGREAIRGDTALAGDDGYQSRAEGSEQRLSKVVEESSGCASLHGCLREPWQTMAALSHDRIWCSILQVGSMEILASWK
jgi:hypothetical protein